MIRTILLPISFLIVALGCSNQAENSQRRGGISIPTVEAAETMYGSLPLEERLSGAVRARNQTEVFAELSAPIIEVLVRDGDSVTEGQPLVRLRDIEARERMRQAEAGFQIATAQVRQAQSSLNQLKNRLLRIRQLSDLELESPAELEALEAQVESAEANVQLAIAQQNQAESVLRERKSALENTVVTSPINGVIGQRNAEVGQFVNPSTKLFEIGDMDHMRVQIILTEQMLTRIRAGMNVQVSSPTFQDTVIRAQVDRISPFLNPVAHSTQAEIEIPNPGRLLKPGMFVTVDVFYGESEQATLIPNNAIYKNPRDGVEGVYFAPSLGRELTFNDEEGNPSPQIMGPFPVEFRPIQVVARGRMVTAIQGVEPEVWVVTLGQNLMVDGSEQARIRMVEWDHILNLQQMQARDLIKIIRDKTAKSM